MLSCLTAIATARNLSSAISVEIVLSRFACSAAFYLGGVFCAVLSLCAFTISKQYWGHFWEDNALLAEVDFQKEFAKKGERLSKLGFGLLVLGAVAFVPGSIMAVAAFFR